MKKVETGQIVWTYHSFMYRCTPDVTEAIGVCTRRSFETYLINIKTQSMWVNEHWLYYGALPDPFSLWNGNKLKGV